MKRKITNVLTLFCLLIGIILAFSFSASAKKAQSGDFLFEVGKKSVTVLEYSGNAKSVTIPSKVNGLPVTKIGEYAFSDRTKMNSVSIPSTVTYIGKAAFNNCPSLTKLSLPRKLMTIEDAAFWYCSGLKNIFIYENVGLIGKDAFRGCNKATFYVVKGTYAETHISSLEGAKMSYRFLTSLKMNKTSVELSVDKTETLSVKTAPENVYNKNVTFKSSDTKVATISSKGVVTAVGAGKAVITATAKDGSKKISSCTVTVLPENISKLKAKPLSATSYKIYWSKAESNIDGYRVIKYDAEKKAWVKLKHTKNTSLTLSSLESGSSTKYGVKAFKKVGSKVYYSKTYTYVTANTLKLEDVKNLTAEKIKSNSIKLKWDAVSTATSYNIYAISGEQKEFVKILNSSKNYITVTNLAPNNNYVFAIKAVFEGKDTNESANFSNSVTVKTLPGKPENFSYNKESLTHKAVTLTWNKVLGADGYILYEYNEETKTYDVIDIINNKDAVSAEVKDLKENSVYYFKLKAFTENESKAGSSSDRLTVVTKEKTLGKDTAIEYFVNILNSVKNSKDSFSLSAESSVIDIEVPKKEEYKEIFDILTEEKSEYYTFYAGKEEESGKNISAFVPPFSENSKLNETMIEEDSLVFAEDGSGYSVSFTLKKDETAEYNKEIAPLLDFSKIEEKHSSFKLLECVYGGTNIISKFFDNSLSYILITVPVTVEFQFNGKTYSLSETIQHRYFFI